MPKNITCEKELSQIMNSSGICIYNIYIHRTSQSGIFPCTANSPAHLSCLTLVQADSLPVRVASVRAVSVGGTGTITRGSVATCETTEWPNFFS
jgi:hypothetical protein